MQIAHKMSVITAQKTRNVTIRTSRLNMFLDKFSMNHEGWFQWPRGIRSGSAPTHLLGLRVRIPPDAWISYKCFVFSGIVSCDGPITRPEESYRISVCVCVCVCVSLSVIRCINHPLHLRWVRLRGQTKKRRKKGRYSLGDKFLWCHGNLWKLLVTKLYTI